MYAVFSVKYSTVHVLWFMRSTFVAYSDVKIVSAECVDNFLLILFLMKDSFK